jgi:hypothetical protein
MDLNNATKCMTFDLIHLFILAQNFSIGKPTSCGIEIEVIQAYEHGVLYKARVYRHN